MKVIGVAGPDGEGVRDVTARLVARLGEEGRVATVVRADDGDGSAEPGTGTTAGGAESAVALRTDPDADVAYRLAGDGSWSAVGGGASLADLLDELAPTADFAVVAGFPTASIPHVAIGGVDHGGETLVEAASASGVDPGAVLEALGSVEPHETLESLVAQVKRAEGADRAGAIATFTGRVREREDADDVPTTHLEFEKYAGVADERLVALEAELEARDGVQDVRLYHRTGVVEAGEDIVFVVVLAGHRGEAFETVRDGIDRLKEEVPIFKKEVTIDGTYWVHDRP